MSGVFTRCEATGKVKHVTKAHAVTTRDKLQKRHGKFRSPPCDVYRCKHCQQFHIGNGDFTKVRGK